MQNNLNHILASVAESIFEQVAFVFTDDTGIHCRPQKSNWDALGAELKFTGTKNGTIHLWLETTLASSIALNMLAAEEPVEKEKAIDAVREMCNIISGNFITTAYQNADIILHIPDSIDMKALGADFFDPDGVWFSSDDGAILVLVKEL
ncbi:MAG: chemotaxis protein CheX [Fibrobacterota bacterium]|jgi:CheY-specific phosphatase CheX|nr:chemotaxis protein CheX [Chitinispirillaceae bacterium]